jgi:hypothetical protein
VTWDPFATLAQTLWIGGGQWAGKSTVSDILAERHGLAAYHYDYHMSRGHWDRRVAAAARAGRSLEPPTAEHMFVSLSPQESAAETVEVLIDTFEYALDDLRAFTSSRPIIAEGFVFRPDLVMPYLRDPRQMVLMVPTDEFREDQSRNVQRAMRPGTAVSDLQIAQRNRMERDRLVSASAVAQAETHGIRVIRIDGTVDAEGVADTVAMHFQPFL